MEKTLGLKISIRNSAEGQKYPFDLTYDGSFIYPAGSSGCKTRVSGTYEILGDMVICEGEIAAAYDINCDLCGKLFRRELVIPFEEVFNADNDSYICDMSVLVLDRLVTDMVLFSLPTRELCAIDCEGLCYICGRDLNAGACGCERLHEPMPERPFDILSKIRGEDNGRTKKKSVKTEE